MRPENSLALGLAALLVAGISAAQTAYPEKTVRIVVGFPPGGPPDVVARLLGQKLTEAWGKPAVIDNVTGASGAIAADRLAKAAPDGHTLGLLCNPELVINPGLYRLAYDPVKDFAPVSQVAVSPLVLVVHNGVPAGTVQELIKLAKGRPGELTFASSGTGSNTHMAAELLKSMAGLDIRHIPYKGVPAAIPDLLGARVTMMFSPTVVVLPLVRDDRLRALAVTSLKRSSAVPELPTIAESGYPAFEGTLWCGLFAPARTPAAVVGKLHLETVKALALPDLRARLGDVGMEGMGNSPDEFAAAIRSQIPKWAKLIKESGIKAE
ncbi:MAG TPA: tripartite tricarboxylate transporter substrate binding protein [Burkholderiales bacterium]|nr:tripartite tricarboxylate transporter substrate binding protein [Burkholderiales bacterium]